MEKLLRYFNKLAVGLIYLFVLAISSDARGQGNCLIYSEDSGERKACELSYKAIEYRQGSIESQMLFDSAIAIGPKYDWAYYQKSVPYFKRGLLSEAIQILNPAISLAPQEYLCYRAYWYFQHQSYSSCLRDLETFYALPNSYLTFTPGGDMDMRLLLSISYAKNSQIEKGIEQMKALLVEHTSDDYVGQYDYYVLGLLYFKNGQHLEAIAYLEKQLTIDSDLINSYYYLGLAQKATGNIKAARINLEKAILRYSKDKPGYASQGLGYRLEEIDVNTELEMLTEL